MKLGNCFISFSLFALVSCNAAQSDIRNVILNKPLIAAQKNYDETWNKKRSALEFSGGRVARNCPEYMELLSKSDISESVNNQIVKNEYLFCDALKLLGKKAQYSSSVSPDFGEKLSTRLDLRSFPSSFFGISDESKHTLSAIDARHLTSRGTVAAIETSDWVFRLEVVAIADINGNGKPDWVIWLSDQAKQGNYRGYATLVAYDVADQGKIIATTYPWNTNR